MPFLREPHAPFTSIVLRAALYALAITVLVLYAPTEEHVFIYQGF